MLPDRNKYVSMDRHFLKSYMDLVVSVSFVLTIHVEVFYALEPSFSKQRITQHSYKISHHAIDYRLGLP